MIPRRGRTLALALVLSMGATVPAAAVDLYGALAAAYDANAQINAQRAATRAADEAIALAKSGYRPQVFSDVSFGFARTVTRGPSPGVAGVGVGLRTANGISTVPASIGIRITQPLFNGFQTVNNVNQAEAQVRASRSQLRSVEQSVLLAVDSIASRIALRRLSAGGNGYGDD